MGPMAPENPFRTRTVLRRQDSGGRAQCLRGRSIFPLRTGCHCFLGPIWGWWSRYNCLHIWAWGPLYTTPFFQQVVEEIMIFSSKFSVPQLFSFDPWTGLGLISLFWDFEHYLQLYICWRLSPGPGPVFFRGQDSSPPAAEDFYGKEGHQVGPLFQVGTALGV